MVSAKSRGWASGGTGRLGAFFDNTEVFDFDANDLAISVATDFAANLTLSGEARVDLSSVTVAAANTDGGVIKIGASGSPVTEDTANMKFVSMYFDDGALSGEAVGIYDRLYVTGAGGEGIALRSFCSVTDVAAGNARGAHISLSFGATGSITGLGAALEATLHINNSGSAAGTLYGVKSAIHSDGAASDPAGATTLAYYAAVNQGDTDGDDDVDTDAVLLDIQGHAAGTGTLFQTVSTAYELGEITNSIKIKVGSTIYHLLASTTGAQAT